jgi:hypothetical protein
MKNLNENNPLIRRKKGESTEELQTQVEVLESSVAQITHIVGERLSGETNDNGRIQRALDASVGGTCKIPSGTYDIYPLGVDSNHYGLSIPSNINIIMEQDTILKCLPQSTNKFTVMTIYNVENVTITGGQIIGDRYEHTGTIGEHGMGINIYHSKNVTLDNVTLKDHWGDCIYIGGQTIDGSMPTPTKITIKNCVLDNSRRQGISSTICDGVVIENCRITNINGTAPEYGIDIETNNPSIPCKNVVVKGCYFKGSTMGGFVIGSSAENVNVDNCIFDGNNVNINKSINSKVTNCTFLSTSVGIRSSNGVVVSNCIMNNSSVDIQTNADITQSTSITSNVFKNNDGSTSRKAISLTGNDNGCYGLSIVSNSFYDYVSETIYLYNITTNTIINNNMIKSNNVSRWILYLKGYDMKFSNNTVIVDLTTSATLNNLLNVTGIRGSFDGNTLRFNNVTMGESLLTLGSITGQTIGMTVSNNTVFFGATSPFIKFSSVSDTKYKILNNDFRYTNSPYINQTGHFLFGNVLSSTVSQ